MNPYIVAALSQPLRGFNQDRHHLVGDAVSSGTLLPWLKRTNSVKEGSEESFVAFVVACVFVELSRSLRQSW